MNAAKKSKKLQKQNIHIAKTKRIFMARKNKIIKKHIYYVLFCFGKNNYDNLLEDFLVQVIF